tara:strand:+ start:579 stop:1301 length:723 start_codon:yes stop_codon:yes gene_type:complete
MQMKTQNNYYALIPARSGSKSIKMKNLKTINKRSLLEIAIDNLKSIKSVNEIYVSSDSQKILRIAKEKNVFTILRPKKISNDTSTANQVIKHFLSKFKISKKNSYLIYMQVTSPLKNYKHLSNAIKKLEKIKSDSLISCYEKDPEQIYKTFMLDNKNRISPIFSKKIATSNRQNLPRTVMPNGAFYIFKIKKKISPYPINFKNCYAYLMNENEVVDINTKKDLNLARKNFKNKSFINAKI